MAQMNQYEGMFLLGQIATAEPDAALNLCRAVIERHEGQILVIKKWDERRLAYELEGQKRGTYIIAYFKAPGEAITAMDRDVRLSEQILRAMFTRADHLSLDEMQAVEPQPVQRETPDRGPGGDMGDRGDRGDRGPRGAAERSPRPRRDEPAETGAAKE